MSILREEAFGAIKTLTRLAHTNPSVGIDRNDDHQAMYMKYPMLSAYLASARNDGQEEVNLTEEAFGAIKTL